MQALATLVLVYLALGAACFAHPPRRAIPADFTWRGQWAIFLDTLPAVVMWPLALWERRL